MPEMSIIRNGILIKIFFKKGKKKEIIIEYLRHVKMTTTNITNITNIIDDFMATNFNSYSSFKTPMWSW